MYTVSDLRQRQALPLEQKINYSKRRIREWYEHFRGEVCVSFSGGKDSLVLLHLVRSMYPDVKAVFCDTGLEFPEVKEYVKSFSNVEVIRPDMNFREVIEKFGWVFPSKEVAQILASARRGAPYALAALDGKNKDGVSTHYKQRYKKWKKYLNEDIKISPRCCDILKKRPFQKYYKKTGLFPYTAVTADEGMRRLSNWLQSGCNIYSKNHESKSRPLSIWLENDVLSYIYKHGLPLCSVYGDLVNIKGTFKTTLEERTGCIFCPIACHLEKGEKRRFIRLKETHRELYNYCIYKLGLKELLDLIVEKENLKYDLY